MASSLGECPPPSGLAASDGPEVHRQGSQGNTTFLPAPCFHPSCDCLPPRSPAAVQLHLHITSHTPPGNGSPPSPSSAGAADHVHRPALPSHLHLSRSSWICLSMLGLTRVTVVVKNKKGRMHLEMLLRRFLIRPHRCAGRLAPMLGLGSRKPVWLCSAGRLPSSETFTSAPGTQRRPASAT